MLLGVLFVHVSHGTGFGKERAEVAKAKNKEQKVAVQNSMKKGAATITKAKEKIALAKEALEKK